MTCKACSVYDESLTAYDFGPQHPLAPIRVRLTMALAEQLGVLDRLHALQPPTAGDALLETVHSKAYVEAVKRAEPDPVHGLGSTDNPVFDGMHEAAAHIAGASVEAAERVWSGEFLHAANIAGGLHHAMPEAASGFCVYNDPALAIRRLLDAGCPRVAYVDVDVHHGDGVQEIFYTDPRVLTISLHESPRTLFPAVSGFHHEIGAGDAEGMSVNVPLPVGTADAEWLRAFHAIVPPLLRAYEPVVLLTQHGCDSHRVDPLAHLALTVDGQRAAALALHEVAHEVCDGRWVATGGGGYALVEVVPRTWTHLLAIVAGSPLEPGTPIPAAWRAEAELRCGPPAPTIMTDHGRTGFEAWSKGYDPASPVDQSIRRTMLEVFPHHGIDPS